MSIQRVPPVPFTQIANSALRDRRLSFKARGLLGLVLSNVGEWNCTLAWLVAQSESDGRVAVQAALNELTELGYRTTHQEHDRKGRLRTIVTWRHEPESTVTRPAENPTDGLPDGRKTRAPLEQQGLEHHPTEHQDNLFTEFWETYPRKIGKGQARKAWAKAIKETDPVVVIAGAVEFYQWCLRDRTETQFIPHPATWLNGERWLDERRPDPTPASKMQGFIAQAERLWDTKGTNVPQLEG